MENNTNGRSNYDASETMEVVEKKDTRKKIAIGAAFAALIVIIIILLLRSCGKPSEPENNKSHAITIDTAAEDKKDIVKEDPLAGRDVFFSGIVDSSISKTGSIQLLNDERNEDFYMTFTVINKDTDEVVYESELVPSGQAIYWVPGEYLEPGTYNLNFKETPYYFPSGSPEVDPEDFMTLSVGNNTVTITIIDR